jgi:hypothetical protein
MRGSETETEGHQEEQNSSLLLEQRDRMSRLGTLTDLVHVLAHRARVLRNISRSTEKLPLFRSIIAYGIILPWKFDTPFIEYCAPRSTNCPTSTLLFLAKSRSSDVI